MLIIMEKETIFIFETLCMSDVETLAIKVVEAMLEIVFQSVSIRFPLQLEAI